MKMIALPNGSFVRADTITAVRSLPCEQGESLHRARVVVHHNGHFREILLANDDEDACRIAAEIVKQITEANEPQIPA